MLIEKLAEELLGGGFGGGVADRPTSFPCHRNCSQIGRIALVDGRHQVVLPSVLSFQRFARNPVFARNMKQTGDHDGKPASGRRYLARGMVGATRSA
jgi:hypothetical protein